MMRLSRSRICRVINCRRRTTRGCKEAGDQRGTDGVRRGGEGGAEGVRRGCGGVLQRGCCRGVQTECQGAPRGRVQRVWRRRWGAWTFLSCWNFSVVAQMPCITSYRQCGAQGGREVVQHIAARSRGTWEWREGRQQVERHAAAMETGKARACKKSCPTAIRLWRGCDA